MLQRSLTVPRIGTGKERINPPRTGFNRRVEDLTVLFTTPLRLGARLLAGKAIC